MIKIGVSSYSFSKLVSSGAIKQIEAISMAKSTGFDVIEFSKLSVPDGETPEHYATRLKEEADRVGLPIANYTIGADFLNNEGGSWEAEATRLRREIGIAKILGSPGMRHDATRGFQAGHKGGKSFDDALPFLVKGCRAVTEYAKEQGIRTMIENHGYFCQDSERVEKLVCGVNNENFGVLLDIGNFLCVDEAPEKAVARLIPYAFHVHAKDFHVKSGMLPDPGRGWFKSRAGNYLKGTIIGHGEVPVPQCLRTVVQSGYNGVLSVEFEGMEDVKEAIASGREYLLRCLA